MPKMPVQPPTPYPSKLDPDVSRLEEETAKVKPGVSASAPETKPDIAVPPQIEVLLGSKVGKEEVNASPSLEPEIKNERPRRKKDEPIQSEEFAKAQPESTQPKPKKKKAAPEDSEKNYITLSPNYKLSSKADSAYRILCRIVAEDGRFAAAESGLPALDASDAEAAKALFGRMFIEVGDVEARMRKDPAWVVHSETRMASLRQRAESGNEKAKSTLANPDRIRDGEWQGDIREMISVCNGSVTVQNRNVRKFREAGVAFMQYPCRPKKGPTYVAMFPFKDLDKVRAMLATVFPENDEKKDDTKGAV